MTATKTRRIPLPILSSPATPPGEQPAVRSDAAPTVPADATRVAMVTLGCDKNTVDSERILARLLGAGVALVEEPDAADVVVVNTCGFIDVAKQESVEAILDAARLKRAGGVRAVVALGCLVQRYKDELAAEMPEVDLFLGLTEADRLLPELRSRGLLHEKPTAVPTMERPLRALSTERPHSSFLKISEGCDHTCAFCAIPLMRGKFRSTPIEPLVREAQELEARGVVELNIVSQDTTWYGRDWRRGVPEETGDFFVGRTFARMAGPLAGERGGGRGRGGTAGGERGGGGTAREIPRTGALPLLLEALLRETSIPWLRLFYMYPSGITRELVELMARESERILPYLDMPIQHGSDAVLARMRRPERRATIRERVGWLRDAVPDLALRTTVIVGFPGETEDDFEALLELLEEVRFDRLGAFSYSPEEGTPAAEMDEQVPAAVRRERLERVLDLQRAITLEKNELWVGREADVLIDRWAGDARGDVAIGRTRAQAPEVDGVVTIRGAGGLRPGELARVRVTEAEEDDLVAEAVRSVER